MFSIYKYLRGQWSSNCDKEEFDDVNDEYETSEENDDEGSEENDILNRILYISEKDVVKEPPKLEVDKKKTDKLLHQFPDLLEPNQWNLPGKITEATSERLEIKLDQHSSFLRVYLRENVATECVHEIGDRVNVQCYVQSSGYTGMSLDNIQVFGIKPAYKRKSIKCTVLKIMDDYIVLDEQSFIRKSLSNDIPQLSVGHVLYVDLIENKMNEFNWRAIRIVLIDSGAAADLSVPKKESKTRLPPPAQVGRWYNYEARLCEYAHQVGTQDAVEVLTTSTKPNGRRFRAVRIALYELPTDLLDTYLKQYDNPREWQKNLEKQYKSLREDLSFENYQDRFSTLLWLEEAEWFKNYRKYDCERAKFTHECNYLALAIKNLAERRPSVVLGDKVRAYIIEEKDEAQIEHDNELYTGGSAPKRCYEGSVVNVLCDKVLIKFDDAFQKAYDGCAYRLEFFFSRISFRRKHHSICRMIRGFTSDFLFPNELRLRAKPQIDLRFDEATGKMYTPTATIKWNNPKLNMFQKRAVFNVLRGEANMMPYIIYGPPGTGKTITLIEVILQLVSNFPKAKLLIAAPSNSATNLICSRLIETKALLDGEMVRLVSYSSIERDQIPASLLKYCATIDMGDDGTYESEMLVSTDGIQMNCTLAKLSRFTVTVSTCAALSKYMELGFSNDHFTHVLMDEAAQCMEPDTMTVISLVSKNNGQVILAGDPKQLPAIIINKYAEYRGLAKSFLERLLDTNPYRYDPIQFEKFNGYNPILVTQLLLNYRALPSILNVYNYLFYEMKLQPMIKETNSHECQLLQKVKNVTFPSENRKESHGSFFYAVRGENIRDRDSPSWYNPREANVVFNITYKLYSCGLKPDSIGIIAPYAKQARYIRNLFSEAKIKQPKIGSVEEFQGQERDVILMSTVRTARREYYNYDCRFRLGFIKSERRFNVAISRARALLIVFGDPTLLEYDANWGIYLNECRTNDSYYGASNVEDETSNDEENYEEKITTENNNC